MLNATNETVMRAANTTNVTTADVGTAVQLLFTVLIPEVSSRYFAFITAPFIYPEMWWLLIHLVLTFVLFEFYFERHDGEDLGWSAALANSIVAIFISMELLRAIYHHSGTPWYVLGQALRDMFMLNEQSLLVTLVLLLGGLGIFTAIINYFHLLPRQFAFLISGHKTINLLAYFLIVVVWRATHGKPIPLDGITLVALFLFGATLWLLLFMVNHRIKRRKLKRSRIIPFS